MEKCYFGKTDETSFKKTLCLFKTDKNVMIGISSDNSGLVNLHIGNSDKPKNTN